MPNYIALTWLYLSLNPTFNLHLKIKFFRNNHITFVLEVKILFYLPQTNIM